MATRPKRPRDTNQLAKMIADISTGDQMDPVPTKKAVAGRAGGLKGGKTRMETLSQEDRSKLAKKAADALALEVAICSHLNIHARY